VCGVVAALLGLRVFILPVTFGIAADAFNARKDELTEETRTIEMS